VKNYIVPLLTVCAVTGIIFFIISCKSQKLASDKPAKKPDPKNVKTATFAGGCFWCIESDYEKLDGVISAVSGYTGGEEKDPTYDQVSAGETGHYEAVKVTYDSSRISYKELVDYLWRIMDPTDNSGSFADRGDQYRPAIFYHDEEQKKAAEASKAALGKSGKFPDPIVTEILPLKEFYVAEEYHQDYYKKNPLRYKYYRFGSGRDQFIEKHWKKEKD
jgi:peptide methionine sulfoxide reductase msrA/msrB